MGTLKYFLLWNCGGVYSDLDITCRRSLVPLLEVSAWFPRASLVGVGNDYFFRNYKLTRNSAEETRTNYIFGMNFMNGAERHCLHSDHGGGITILPRIFYDEVYTFLVTTLEAYGKEMESLS